MGDMADDFMYREDFEQVSKAPTYKQAWFEAQRRKAFVRAKEYARSFAKEFDLVFKCLNQIDHYCVTNQKGEYIEFWRNGLLKTKTKQFKSIGRNDKNLIAALKELL